jgi:hypothetical protein
VRHIYGDSLASLIAQAVYDEGEIKIVPLGPVAT